jgi:hypothetical protein
LLENSPDMFVIGNGKALTSARTQCAPMDAQPRVAMPRRSGNLIEYESASVPKTLGRSLIGCAAVRAPRLSVRDALCVRRLKRLARTRRASGRAYRSDVNFSTLTHPDDVARISERACCAPLPLPVLLTGRRLCSLTRRAAILQAPRAPSTHRWRRASRRHAA